MVAYTLQLQHSRRYVRKTEFKASLSYIVKPESKKREKGKKTKGRERQGGERREGEGR